LESAPDVKDGTGSKSQILRQDRMVSDYAFRKLIKKNFNNVVLGNESYSKISRYATLDLSDHPSFSFSPYYFESDPIYAPYKNIFSVNIAGKLNDDDFFSLSDWRDLSASFSYIHMFNSTNYKTIEKPSTLKDKYKCKIRPLLNEVFEKHEKKFAALCKSDECKMNEDALIESKNETIDALIEDYTDAEIKVAEEYWKNKNFFWIKADAKILAFDRVQFISSDLLQNSNYQTQEEVIYIPAISFAFNYLTKNNKKDNSFLLTTWISLQKKHSLSEVFSSDDFQPFHPVNDSLIQLKTKEEVFITDFSEIKKKLTLDYGFRLVAMGDISSPNRPRQIGASFQFSRSGLVHTDSYPSLFKTEIGAILPFLGKDGESEFNLEIFYRWNIYSNFPNDNEATFGLRFNVPINNN
jgi:hypothetical protein